MPQYRSKGSAFASFLEVMRERLSAAELATLEQNLPPESAVLLKRRILAVEWLPVELTVPITEVLLTRVFNNDEAKLIAIVHEASARDYAGIYKLLIRMLSPRSVSQRASKIFSTFVESGTMTPSELPRVGNRERYALDVDYAPYPNLWLVLRGYIETPLLLTGAKNLTVKLVSHSVQADSAKLRYEVEYDA